MSERKSVSVPAEVGQMWALLWCPEGDILHIERLYQTLNINNERLIRGLDVHYHVVFVSPSEKDVDLAAEILERTIRKRNKARAKQEGQP